MLRHGELNTNYESLVLYRRSRKKEYVTFSN
jgi:hypothetical protein